MMKYRKTAAFLALQIFLCIVFSAVLPVLAAEDVVVISSAEDFLKFSKKCTADSYSEGRKFSLSCDINFSKSDFMPVPIFCGEFDGKGHKISGIKFDEKGSYQGVFRYVKEGAEISNLVVEGKIVPGGSKSFVGGIAGQNSGVLKNCSFDGTVEGENVVGGISGENTETGKIISCKFFGSISGENSTGGISGKNSGFIQSCKNQGAVNTVYGEKKKNLSDLETDTGAILENYKNFEEENEEESVLGHSDTGGIAGLNSGIIQGCENSGAVGYEHIGYNVGGIAGRQSGYILGCENRGLIRGRKDVGGIVGQAEPYILLNSSESVLRDLRKELDNLNSMVNKFISDTENLADDTEKHLNNVSDYAKEAGDSAEDLLDQTADFADDNLSEINAKGAILSNTLKKLEPAFESLDSGIDYMAKALNEISDSIDGIDITFPELGEDIDDIGSAIDEIIKAEGNLRRAVNRFEDAKEALERAVVFEEEAEVKNAANKLANAVKDMITAKQTIKQEVEKIESVLKSHSENFESIGINAKEIAECLKVIAQNNLNVIKSLQTVQNNLNTIALNTKVHFYEFKLAAQNIEEAFDFLDRAIHYINGGFEELADALGNVSDSLEGFSDELSAELKEAKEGISNGIKKLGYGAEDIEEATKDIKDIIKELAEDDPIEFVKLGDDFKNTSQSLFDSLSAISDELSGLKNTVSRDGDLISADLSSVTNQFDLVMNLLIDEFEDIKNGVKNLSDIFLDVSDEDIKNTKQGKIEDCRNFGKVEADKNAGGIAGAVAIEYSKDPEDDIEKPESLNFTYQTKAVLQSCVNDGKISGKKSCTGGIAGFAEIGTIFECENYGHAKSEKGTYVGGIVGKGEGSVRKSYAKSVIEGKRFVGGIAGKAKNITNCCVIARTEGEENVGAICGDGTDKESLFSNFYVESGTGAVDGISYKGKAEEISFDELAKKSGVPQRFVSFSITFFADGKVVETRELKYGESTEKIKYPDVPEKEGHFGNWQKPEAETVKEDIEIQCDYKPYITVISSEEKNESGKLSLALCDGKFSDKAKILVKESNEKPATDVKENVKVYDILISGDKISDNEKVTLRILNENKGRAKVWILENGKWKSTKPSYRGKYAVISTVGAKNTICIKYEKASRTMLIFTLIFVICAATATALILKKKKNEKK